MAPPPWASLVPLLFTLAIDPIENLASATKAQLANNKARVTVTTKHGAHWEESFVSMESSPRNRSAIRLAIDVEGEDRQTILGFGAAITQAAGMQFQRLDKSLRHHVLKMYFSDEGLAYNVLRVPIGSCDFSPYSYSFAEKPNDLSLEAFDGNLTQDEKLGVLDLIRESNAYIVERAGRGIAGSTAEDPSAGATGTELIVFGSPWSPPSWMKTGNHTMVGSARPCLKEDSSIHRAWALYFAEWIASFETRTGVKVWGVTAQNEPAFYSNDMWEACSYTAAQQRDFIRDHLGPVFESRFGPGAKKIMHYDYNKAHVVEWADTVLSDPLAAKYIWGTALHWYDGDYFNHVAMLHAKYQASHHLLATEGCNCEYDLKQYPHDWARARRYAHDMIGDINHGVEGWVDWNLLLNIKKGGTGQGGPNHAGNFCWSHINVDKEGNLVVHPSYYVFGQISKFLPRGSIILDHNLRWGQGWPLEALAARRPDGSVVAVVLNNGEHDQDIYLKASGWANGEGEGFNFKMKGDSIATFELSPPTN